MIVEQTKMAGKVRQCVETVDVEKVLPIATSQEKRLRFEWERLPSQEFLMNWNFHMEPNQMFVEELNEKGIAVTVRWGLMEQPAEKIADYVNRWLEKCEAGTYKRSGIGGFRLQ